jgi:hypothetical protein
MKKRRCVECVEKFLRKRERWCFTEVFLGDSSSCSNRTCCLYTSTRSSFDEALFGSTMDPSLQKINGGSHLKKFEAERHFSF